MAKEPQLNLKDHDLLIGLDTKFDLFSVQIAKDIAELKDGVNSRLLVVEQKTLGYDKLINEIDPLKLAQMAYAHEDFITKFKLTYKVMLTFSTVVGAIVGFLISILTLYFNFLRIK